MTRLSFLGTGNFLAPGRYWNGFVIDEQVLVETSPTTLPHLRRSGISTEQLDCISISHFHPDHTFGWPFLLLEIAHSTRDRPLYVVGPPGVRRYLEEMMRLGSVTDVHDVAHANTEIVYVEADTTTQRDGAWQEAGPVRFQAVEVDHVPALDCFGYLFERGDRIVGYSGDTRPCAGLDELADAADVLVVECNGLHASESHMDVGSIRSLHERFPETRLVLSHLGEGIDIETVGLSDIAIPGDFDTIEW